MRIGKLRHRLTIQAYTETVNTFGEPVKTWADVNTVWCAIEPLKGREYMAAKETQSEVNVRVRMRYRTGMAANMRLYGGGKYYEITDVQQFEEGPSHKETVCMCREIST